MTDPRPAWSPMPAPAREIAETEAEIIREAVSRAWSSALALPGPNAEIENDALSVIGHLAALTGAMFLARLARMKGVTPELAWAVAVTNLQVRMQAILHTEGEKLAETVQ